MHSCQYVDNFGAHRKPLFVKFSSIKTVYMGIVGIRFCFFFPCGANSSFVRFWLTLVADRFPFGNNQNNWRETPVIQRNWAGRDEILRQYWSRIIFFHYTNTKVTLAASFLVLPLSNSRLSKFTTLYRKKHRHIPFRDYNLFLSQYTNPQKICREIFQKIF